MAYFKKKKNQNLYVRKANLSILNCPELKKFSRIKYYTIKYDKESKEFKTNIIYKAFGSLTKIFIFDSFISYKKQDENIIHPFVNVYIPTILMDYIKFVYKDSILLRLSDIKIENIKQLEEDVFTLFKTQNKFYTEDDYKALIEEYKINSESTYKDKAKALNSYVLNKQKIPGFYFWLAVIYGVFPFVHYLGKTSLEKGNETYDKIFFIYPDRNDNRRK